ncbi:MAG: glycosyl transferase [Anaerolineaceae bacterium]|nr:glycosyl transferase [Anaerolineaceae bacterium]|tara:strand:+ start:48248 stop:48961 length:714 start_codon:yes stop_codon:yes gene_type:complete
MIISIIVCAYNERDTILDVLQGINDVDFGNNWSKEIIVVDNCSTDGTREILKEGSWPDTKIIFNNTNLGKSASIRVAINALSGDYAVIQDADLEYDPSYLPNLLEKTQTDNAIAVLGSRILGGRPNYIYYHAFLGVRLLTVVTNLLYGSQLTDVATAIKLVRSDVLKSLNLVGEGFELDFELVDKLLLAGHHIHEVPLSYNPRTYAQGKKIRTIDGLRALRVIVRDRLGFSSVYKIG